MTRLTLYLVFLFNLCSCISFAENADPVALRNHVLQLTAGPGFRNIDDTTRLNEAANYIYTEFAKTNADVSLQSYQVDGKQYSNIIASFGPLSAPRIIVGAHYDVCEQQQGADDNASGVAGILELARMLSKQDSRNWKNRVDIVAYTLEEPPSFRTGQMGSAVHARMLYDEQVEVRGMISVEMIGYYKDAKNTQRYPIGLLKAFYGSRGNYITLVRKFGNGSFPRVFTRRFKQANGNVITKVFKGPRWIPGLDFSDHLNYWAYGWPALMITDTSFYRNSNYHERTDTPDTLDYERMRGVVERLYGGLLAMLH